jgi:hypothetical protein
MTYKQVQRAVQTILQSHAMIKDVRFVTAKEWIKRDSDPLYPVCCYDIFSGSFQPGYKTFQVRFLFLDQTGMDGEYEIDVVSDQTEIANDILALVKQRDNNWIIDTEITFEVLLGEFEDNLSGVQLTINIKTLNNYDTCAIPYNA